jgi:hypothetical protein
VVKALALGASLARGMGSNPIACTTSIFLEWPASAQRRGCSSLGRAVGSQSAGTGIETLLLQTMFCPGADWAILCLCISHASVCPRQWCIGNIEASQALAPGSTPGWRIHPFASCFDYLNQALRRRCIFDLFVFHCMPSHKDELGV